MPIVKKEQTVRSWSALIEGAQGNTEKVFGDTEKFIKESKAPNVRVVKRKVSPGLLRGLLGGSREFLVVTETGNSNLKPYQMFINARDYGNNLDVSWYLLFRISFWQKLALFLCLVPIINLLVIPIVLLQRVFQARSSGMMGLDFFDEQDLSSYVTNAHECFKSAITLMMQGINKDPSTIDWKARGFLGIS